jgi:hypothetical protein
MTLDEQSKALAEWLEQNPGSPPPEGVDEEVLQAIYVFRPDLAPPANVSIDDILARVESGPFAQATPLQASGKPRSAQPEESLASRKHRRRFWSGAGAIAAAAAVLIIALPQQKEAAKIGPQMQPQHAVQRHNAPPPPSQPESSSAVEKEKPAEAKREMVQEIQTGFSSGILDGSAGGVGGVGGRAGGGMTASIGEAAAAPENEDLLEEAEESIAEALDLAENTLDLSRPSEDLHQNSGLSFGSASTSEIDFEGIDVASELVKPQSELLLDRRQAPVSATAEKMEEAEDLDTLLAAEPASESQDQSRLFRRKSRAAEAPAAPRASAAPQVQDAAPEKNTTALASLAIPADYLPPPNNLPSTSQWRVAENARAALGEKRFDEAQSIAATGLNLSAENTPALSMLHYVLGRCASQAGRESEANTFFEKAIALNTERK